MLWKVILGLLLSQSVSQSGAPYLYRAVQLYYYYFDTHAFFSSCDSQTHVARVLFFTLDARCWQRRHRRGSGPCWRYPLHLP